MWLYPSLFLLESVSLYLYYYLWDSLSGDKKWVHVLIGGTIVAAGGRDLADRLDAGGYDLLKRELGIESEEESDPLKGL